MRQQVLFVIAVSVLLPIAHLAAQPPTDPGTRPVEVVNQPLDVVVTEGSVEIEAGNSGIPVVVEGATATLPVAIQGPPAIPLLLRIGDFSNGFTGEFFGVETIDQLCVGAIPVCNGSGIYQVPDDKVLLIEQISFFGNILSSQIEPDNLFATLHVTPPNADTFIFMLGRAFRISDNLTWLGGTSLSIQAPAGSRLRLVLAWDQGLSSASVNGGADISGRLVNAL